jgi:hypothetical protein
MVVFFPMPRGVTGFRQIRIKTGMAAVRLAALAKGVNCLYHSGHKMAFLQWR